MAAEPPPTTEDAWDPAQYERFRAERRQPFWDLLQMVETRHPQHVVDLGCGTGELTLALHHELQSTDTVGVDASPAMLGRTAQIHERGLRFVRADIADWRPRRRFDIVFSNAALQWLPDHPALFRRIAAMVAPKGELAVQMPANDDHPSHTIAAAVAQEEPFRDALGGYRRETAVLPPEGYAVVLHQAGLRPPRVRLQVYTHELTSSSDVVEWVRGTLLTDYETRMPAGVYGEFLTRYRTRFLDAVGDTRPYLYAFKRILLWAWRPEPGVTPTRQPP